MAKGPGPYSGGSPGLKPAPKKKKKARKKEVAGPYRSQSSNPKIRSEATAEEHRKVPVKKKSTPAALKTPKAFTKGYTGKGRQAEQDDFPDVGSVLEDVASALRNPTEKITGKSPGREFAEDEAATVVKALKDSLERAKSGEGHLRTPTKEQVQAAATLAGLKGAGKAATAGEKALTKATAAASDASWAKTAASKAAKAVKSAPKRKAARIKSAPKRAAKRVKETPQRVRTAPTRAKKAASTPEGRRAAAKGTGRRVAQHPFASLGGAGVVSNQSGADIPGLKEAGAFVEGHLQADPWQSAKTTARAIPGIVTGPAALIGSAGASALSGSTKPLEKEASEQFEGLVDMGGKLLSGDPETVRKSVEDEVGYSMLVQVPAISRLRKTKAYKQGRGKLRKAADRPRARKRAKAREAVRKAKLENRVVSGKQAKRVKKTQPVIDSATGEAYALPGLGRKIENRRGRVDTARDLARTKSSGEIEARRAQAKIVKEIRRSKLSKGEHNVGDVLATVAQYGISRDKVKGLKQLDDLERSIGKNIDPDAIPSGIVNDLANIRWIRENADAFFKDKHFWKALDEYKARAAEVSTSKRKENLAVGDVYGVKRPEERMADAGVTPYKQLETYERKRAELGELKGSLSKAEKLLAKDLTPEDRAKAQAAYEDVFQQAVKLNDEVSRQRRAKEAADAEFGAEVQGVIGREGLEQPAYVRDVRPRAEGETLPAYYQGKPSSRPHMADIEQARRGVEIDRSFKTLMDQSVGAPRLREHFHAATTNFVERNAQTINGERYITSEQFARAVERGDIDPSQFAMMPAQQFKRAILDPHKNDGFTDDLNASLRGELQAKANQPGNKYAVVPKEALREFVHQFEPPKGLDKALGPANRFFTRAILGYSPGWAAAQVIAEGIPAVVSVGANPARWGRIAKYLAREQKRLSRKDRAVIDGMIGESPGITPQPRTQLTTTLHRDSARMFQLMERNAVGRALLKTGKGEVLGGFDRWKGGKYRKIVALAKKDKELNGALTSMRELMRGQRRVSEALKGKPLKAQMEWMAKHPAELAKLEGHLDNVMGNWRAMTRLEAKFAPAVVFYPFLRYSLRWTFWSFPKEHPVKAQILYFLSQQNAEELEKIVGGPPANPVDYTFPVYTNSDGGNSVMPGGQRFAPGMNAITTAIGKGRIETMASGLNPAVGFGYTLLSGNDPFTGEKVASSPVDNGLLALNQLLSMPAPLRLTLPDEVPVFGGSSVRDTAMQALGKEPPSDISKAFKGMDPNREARSFYNPLAPQSASRYRDATKLSKALEESGWDPELGEDVVTQAVLAARKGDRRLVKELIKRRKASDKASDEISRLVREYVSDPQQLPKFTDRDWKVVNEITGEMVIPYTPPKKDGNPYLEALEPSKKGNAYLEALEQDKGGNAYLKALE